jgi:hypothetical protein
VLFGDELYLVVKSLKGLYVYNRQTEETKEVLPDLNMRSIHYGKNIVYFKAEDDFGNPINGHYSIDDEQLTYYSLYDNFNEIKSTQR